MDRDVVVLNMKDMREEVLSIISQKSATIKSRGGVSYTMISSES